MACPMPLLPPVTSAVAQPSSTTRWPSLPSRPSLYICRVNY
jgi:hypothetical protein